MSEYTEFGERVDEVMDIFSKRELAEMVTRGWLDTCIRGPRNNDDHYVFMSEFGNVIRNNRAGAIRAMNMKDAMKDILDV